MSNEQSASMAGEQGVNLGKFWAAVRGELAIGVISMSVPNDVDFDEYRKRAIAVLELLGDVKSGELYEKSGRKFFVQQFWSHKNRSKKAAQEERGPRVYPLFVATGKVDEKH